MPFVHFQFGVKFFCATEDLLTVRKTHSRMGQVEFVEDSL